MDELPSALPRITTVALTIGGLSVAAFALGAARGIVGPVALAAVLVICVSPIKHALTRRGVPTGLATGAVIGSTFVLLALFVGSLVLALAQFGAMLPTYSQQFRELGVQLAADLARLGVGQEQLHAVVSGFDLGRILGIVTNVLGGATNLLVAFVIVFTMLLLMGQDATYLPSVLRTLGGSRPHLVAALTAYSGAVRRYMVATIVLGVVQGALNGLLLWMLGVPAAFLWAVLTFLCSFIPNVGFFIAIVPPLVFGLLVGGWQAVIVIIVGYSLINTVVQSIVQPRFVGGVVSLSQTLTFLSVLVWAVILGPIGAILAVPLTLLVRTLLIDAEPQLSARWRPLTGDVAAARAELRAARLAGKATKTERRGR